MGGIPCDIIINCGIVKGAAAALIVASKDHLRAAGAQLRDQNDEICRFGETTAILDIEFTEEQEHAIYSGGADAITLTEEIKAYVYAEHHQPDDDDNLLAHVRAFIQAQANAFRQIVRELYEADET